MRRYPCDVQRSNNKPHLHTRVVDQRDNAADANSHAADSAHQQVPAAFILARA
jgi:hypothetical protein